MRSPAAPLLALYVAFAGCSPATSNPDPTGAGSGGAGGASTGSGGSVASGGAGGSSGGTTPTAGNGSGASGGTGGSSAGTGSALGGKGGAGTGGSNAAGATSGGSGGRDASGGTAGSGRAGSGSAGRDGSGGSGGPQAGSGSGGTAGSGSSVAPKPSPGCGKGGRPSGGKVEVANTSLHMFPADYDGTKPYPLLIALHACGNPNSEFVSLTNGTDFETGYVRTFPNTPDSGQCWSNYSGDVSRITSQYDDIMQNYCVDENRVFAIAHSSGAQLLVNILSHKSDADHLNLKGISPVAADPYNVAVPMPVLYIDGKNDNQRSADSAKNAVAKFRMSNACADTSMPYSSVMTCNSTDSGHPKVDPGCIIYDGCVVPTIWCSHNDPSYSGTEHGVPCFAMQAMVDFFGSLK